MGLRRLMIAASTTPSDGLAALFASGERGLLLDPSDFSSLFQDIAGTTPVTAVGQYVGKILDKSGNANHLAAPADANRPILQQDSDGKYYLQFTIANSTCLVASATLAMALRTDAMMSFTGVRFDDSTSGIAVWARAKAAGVLGRYWLERSASAFLQITFGGSTTVSGGGSDPSNYTNKRVVTGTIDRPGGSINERVNGSAFGSGGTLSGSDTTSDQNQLYRFILGGYNNSNDSGQQSFFGGRIYGLAIRFGTVNATLRNNAEATLASKMAVAF